MVFPVGFRVYTPARGSKSPPRVPKGYLRGPERDSLVGSCRCDPSGNRRGTLGERSTTPSQHPIQSSMKLTYIEWDDSTSPQSGPWINEDDPQLDISKPYLIVSVGFVIRENKHYVQLASSSDRASCDTGDFKGTQVGGVMNIPRRQISKRCEFEIGAKVAKVPRIEYRRI